MGSTAGPITPRFITFEGGEGAGKSTQVGHLSRGLMAASIPAVTTREPGGAPGAEVLRGILLAGDHDWSPLAETLLHFAARAEHVARTIRPALAAGSWVVCDRFTDSTRAYQGYGQGAAGSDIATLAGLLGITPDLTVVLDIPDDVARARLARRGGGDRYERLGPAFFARVNAAFREIARAEPERCVLLAGDGTEAEIAAAVRNVVRERLGLAL